MLRNSFAKTKNVMDNRKGNTVTEFPFTKEEKAS